MQSNGLTEHPHANYGIRTFRLDPSARNKRALRAYAKAGFSIDPGYTWDRRPDYHDPASMKREIAPNQAMQLTGKAGG